MFYSQIILAKKGPLGKIWLAAHGNNKKLSRPAVFATDISASVDSIVHPAVPLALRLSGHLMLGVVRIYSLKVKFLMHDCHEAAVKIKLAFRPMSGTGPGGSGGAVIDMASAATSGHANSSHTRRDGSHSHGNNNSNNLNVTNFGEYQEAAWASATAAGFEIPFDLLDGDQTNPEDWIPAEIIEYNDDDDNNDNNDNDNRHGQQQRNSRRRRHRDVFRQAGQDALQAAVDHTLQSQSTTTNTNTTLTLSMLRHVEPDDMQWTVFDPENPDGEGPPPSTEMDVVVMQGDDDVERSSKKRRYSGDEDNNSAAAAAARPLSGDDDNDDDERDLAGSRKRPRTSTEGDTREDDSPAAPLDDDDDTTNEEEEHVDSIDLPRAATAPEKDNSSLQRSSDSVDRLWTRDSRPTMDMSTDEFPLPDVSNIPFDDDDEEDDDADDKTGKNNNDDASLAFDDSLLSPPEPVAPPHTSLNLSDSGDHTNDGSYNNNDERKAKRQRTSGINLAAKLMGLDDSHQDENEDEEEDKGSTPAKDDAATVPQEGAVFASDDEEEEERKADIDDDAEVAPHAVDPAAEDDDGDSNDAHQDTMPRRKERRGAVRRKRRKLVIEKDRTELTKEHIRSMLEDTTDLVLDGDLHPATRAMTKWQTSTTQQQQRSTSKTSSKAVIMTRRPRVFMSPLEMFLGLEQTLARPRLAQHGMLHPTLDRLWQRNLARCLNQPFPYELVPEDAEEMDNHNNATTRPQHEDDVKEEGPVSTKDDDDDEHEFNHIHDSEAEEEEAVEPDQGQDLASNPKDEPDEHDPADGKRNLNDAPNEQDPVDGKRSARALHDDSDDEIDNNDLAPSTFAGDVDMETVVQQQHQQQQEDGPGKDDSAEEMDKMIPMALNDDGEEENESPPPIAQASDIDSPDEEDNFQLHGEPLSLGLVNDMLDDLAEDEGENRRQLAGDELVASTSKWHKHTVTVYNHLRNNMVDPTATAESNENKARTLSYKRLSHGSSRRTAAGVFFELLQLKTWDYIELNQAEAYGDIKITPGLKFHVPPPQN